MGRNQASQQQSNSSSGSDLGSCSSSSSNYLSSSSNYLSSSSGSRETKPFDEWTTNNSINRSKLPIFYFAFVVFVAFIILLQRFDCNSVFTYSSSSVQKSISPTYHATNSTLKHDSTQKSPPLKPKPKEYPLICNTKVTNQTCPYNYPTIHNPTNPSRPSTCPDYFRWIHEDLRPWKVTGVTRGMVEAAQRTAHFRIVILKGRLYVEKYKKFEGRAKFTLWGILQLLRWYPGRLPDLELMFDCDDRPVIKSEWFVRPNSGPPALFRYCSDPASLDIVFPDWTFWGWAETNIKPWRKESQDIQEGNKRIKWKNREPYAYWRGNPFVAPWRFDLLYCNISHHNDSNTLLYIQDWIKQANAGYKESNLEDQCTHRYKIYIEGYAWSVSEKYILACDSMTLLIKPQYYDFFDRGMLPLKHYWPIREKEKCKSLKFAVEWGNNHPDKAQAIGQAGSRYIHEDVKMEMVYDYMFHLLNEYAKLLKFEPVVPPNGIELCPETMACQNDDFWRNFMESSLEKRPSEEIPCELSPSYEPMGLKDFLDRKANLTRQVEIWEDEYWAKLSSPRHLAHHS